MSERDIDAEAGDRGTLQLFVRDERLVRRVEGQAGMVLERRRRSIHDPEGCKGSSAGGSVHLEHNNWSR